MSTGGSGDISIVDPKLYDQILTLDQKLKSIRTKSSQFIFRIDHVLGRTNEKSYVPKTVSIGPYHRGKEKLQNMEEYKLKYLQGILERGNQTSASRYMEALAEEEEKARSSYAEHVSLSREHFIEMMVLDGCFILEFFRKYKRRHLQQQISQELFRDFLLFDNQIPFFILVKLFGMTKISDEEDFISLVTSCVNGCIWVDDESTCTQIHPDSILHLLDLCYRRWCSPWSSSVSAIDMAQEKDIKLIKSVSELEKDGIEFWESKQPTPWHAIKFENRKIKIPLIVIQNDTQSILRNLIAYERHIDSSVKIVTDYVALMSCLVKSEMDVRKLCNKGIIENWLGSDNDITAMFNRMVKNVRHVRRSPNFTYRDFFEGVNTYCSKRHNPWIANFRRTYFKNPWTAVGFLTACLLFVMIAL